MTAKLRIMWTELRKASKAKLDAELSDFAVLAGVGRNQRIVARHLGWDGSEGGTLQETGREYSLTRERVRQLVARVTERVKTERPFAPALDRALYFIGENLPSTAEQVEIALRSEGFTTVSLSIEGVETAAHLLGREPGFSLERSAKRRLVVPAGVENIAVEILRAARRATEHWGVATVQDVAATAAHATADAPEFVMRVLTARRDFEWLDKDAGWFWLRSVPRNRVLNQMEKVFAVSPRISVTDLRAGVSRPHRMKGFAPPRRVLAEMCRQIGYRSDGDVLIADPPPEFTDALSDSEQVLANILNQNGRVMQREALERLSLAQGLTQATLQARLSYSPIIQKLGPSVYGLRGAPVTPGLVDALAPPKTRSRVLKDYGWTRNGMIWVAFRLSASMLSSGVFHVPAAMRKHLLGEFQLFTVDGARIGKLVIAETGSWGLTPLYSRRGGEIGDPLVLVFDLAERRANAMIGDESAIENLSDSEDVIERETDNDLE